MPARRGQLDRRWPDKIFRSVEKGFCKWGLIVFENGLAIATISSICMDSASGDASPGPVLGCGQKTFASSTFPQCLASQGTLLVALVSLLGLLGAIHKAVPVLLQYCSVLLHKLQERHYGRSAAYAYKTLIMFA